MMLNMPPGGRAERAESVSGQVAVMSREETQWHTPDQTPLAPAALSTVARPRHSSSQRYNLNSLTTCTPPIPRSFLNSLTPHTTHMPHPPDTENQ